MKNVRILDCTLRDGGRLIDCNFNDKDIKDISERLADANIDIIEIGFLRDKKIFTYKGNSTFFTSVNQIKPFINRRLNDTMYVAFVDFGMFDFDSLEEYDGTSIEGIRVGFTKKNYESDKDEVIRCLKIVKNKGYKLFIQGVNSIGYTDKELLDIIEMTNSIEPYSFGIVDTYGAMYAEDVRHYFLLINNNLNEDICIDFHSHNNYQLSFSLAQEVVNMGKDCRKLIIDSTLNGMGKCAGNLNTELIVDYMVRKKHCSYDFDEIIDIIDDYMYSIKENNDWGFSIPAMLSGVYKAHPNNVIYLNNKYRLSSKDVKYILSMIDSDVRLRYDYENIQRLYEEYNHTKVDDKQNIKRLKELLENKNILLLLPGKSINIHYDMICDYIKNNDCYVISVNHITDFVDRKHRIAFFGGEKRYKCFKQACEEKNVVITSNVKSRFGNELIINYESVIEHGNEDFDNSMIMVLNLLHRLGISTFSIAGFDGYVVGEKNYFDLYPFEEERFKDKYVSINTNMRKMLKDYIKRVNGKNKIKLITPSIYSDIFD